MKGKIGPESNAILPSKIQCDKFYRKSHVDNRSFHHQRTSLAFISDGTNGKSDKVSSMKTSDSKTVTPHHQH